MTEIPADIMQAAREIAEKTLAERHGMKSEPLSSELSIAARAILAERERCVKIVQNGEGRLIERIVIDIQQGYQP